MDEPFSLFGVQSESDLAICTCEKVGKIVLVNSTCMRVLQSVALLILSLTITATLIVIRDSPTLNTNSNSVLLGYELSLSDVNRLQNYQKYENYLSKQFLTEEFDLNSSGGNSNGLHLNISSHSRQLDLGDSMINKSYNEYKQLK